MSRAAHKAHRHRLRTALLVAAVLLLAGCETFDRRIREKAAVFDSLPAETQQRLRQGEVAVGDTPDQVYIALGRPSLVLEKQGPDSASTVWLYRSLRREPAGRAFDGYIPAAVQDPKTGRIVTFFEPIYTDVYRERSEDRLRITFTGDRVSMIDRLVR